LCHYSIKIIFCGYFKSLSVEIMKNEWRPAECQIKTLHNFCRVHLDHMRYSLQKSHCSLSIHVHPPGHPRDIIRCIRSPHRHHIRTITDQHNPFPRIHILIIRPLMHINRILPLRHRSRPGSVCPRLRLRIPLSTRVHPCTGICTST